MEPWHLVMNEWSYIVIYHNILDDQNIKEKHCQFLYDTLSNHWNGNVTSWLHWYHPFLFSDMKNSYREQYLDISSWAWIGKHNFIHEWDVITQLGACMSDYVPHKTVSVITYPWRTAPSFNMLKHVSNANNIMTWHHGEIYIPVVTAAEKKVRTSYGIRWWIINETGAVSNNMACHPGGHYWNYYPGTISLNHQSPQLICRSGMRRWNLPWVPDISQDDVIKWKHFPRYWPFVRGIHWWIPRKKASDAELWCFFDLRLE